MGKISPNDDAALTADTWRSDSALPTNAAREILSTQGWSQEAQPRQPFKIGNSAQLCDRACSFPQLLKPIESQLQIPKIEIPQEVPVATDAVRHTRTVEVDGVKRHYNIRVPKNYDESKPVPVVYCFHGLALNKEEMQGRMNLDAEADKKGFLLVFVDGSELQSKSFVYDKKHGWAVSNFPLNEKGPGLPDRDIKLIEQVRAAVKKDYKIAPASEILVGFSNGAMLVGDALHKVSGIKGAVMVAGAVSTKLEKELKNLNFTPKNDTTLRIFNIHAKDDELVPVAGYGEGNILFPSATSFDKSNQHFLKVTGLDESKRIKFESMPFPVSLIASSITRYIDPKQGRDFTSILVGGRHNQWPPAANQAILDLLPSDSQKR